MKTKCEQRKASSTNIITIMESGAQTMLSRPMALIRPDEQGRRSNPVRNLEDSNEKYIPMSIGKKIVYAKIDSVKDFKE